MDIKESQIETVEQLVQSETAQAQLDLGNQIDFEKEYHFQDNDLLLLISINGNTFYFDKRVVHHILKCSVNTWLISCKDNINFSKNYLYIPTLNDKYNDYLLRHILDFILMY